jgi:hypothetical protein
LNCHHVARGPDETGVTKRGRAGVKRAVSPLEIGGHRLAHPMLRPAVVDFFETALRHGGTGSTSMTRELED